MSKEACRYLLGLDIGSASIGWCAYRLDEDGEPIEILDLGSRIFSDGRDPQSREPLAVSRRLARQQRRRRDRFLVRKKKLLKTLLRLELLPKDEDEARKLATLDPYRLRAEALDRALLPHELARVLIHINQRRGFYSNRKKISEDKDGKKLKEELNSLEEKLKEYNARTIGELFFKLKSAGKSVRARLGEGLYPRRRLYTEELATIWKSQKRFFPKITDEDWDNLCQKVILFQRPLRPQEPGYCQFYYTEGRIRGRRALSSFQRFRFLQNLNQLQIITPDRVKEPLTEWQWDKIAAKLNNRKSGLKFDDIRKELKLSDEYSFNLESDRRKDLKGDGTAYTLSGKNFLGAKIWGDLSLEQRDRLVDLLCDDSIDDNERIRIFKEEFSFSEEVCDRLLELDPAQLESAYGEFCPELYQKLVPLMDAPLRLPYHEAIQKLGLHHSYRAPGELLPQLPYYSELLGHSVIGAGKGDKNVEEKFGKIPNPTVHIALNQLRQLVNAVIDRYGNPERVVVEVARDLPLGADGLKSLLSEQSKNNRENEKYREEISKLLDVAPDLVKPSDVKKYKLWNELGPLHICVYSGKSIPPHKLFTEEIQIEHILPESRTFDSSNANLTVCYREWNIEKGERSPYEAFGYKDSYKELLARAAILPGNKRWRFDSDAMESFKDESAFLARDLHATKHTTRLALRYLSAVCKDVMAVKPKVISFLRGSWNLNRVLSASGVKNRDDHRHHAVDAAVIGAVSRTLSRRITWIQKRGYTQTSAQLPWENFKRDLVSRVGKIIVSHRPDHSVYNKLFEETSYGVLKEQAKERAEGYGLVRRKAIEQLSESEISGGAILDGVIAGKLNSNLEAKEDLKGVLSDFTTRERVKRVRVLLKDPGATEISFRQGKLKHKKALISDGNQRVEFWLLPNGETKPVTVDYLMALKAYESKNPNMYRPHPAAKKLMVVYKGDVLKIEEDGEERIVRVVRINPASNRFYSVGHQEAGNLSKRVDDKELKWRYVSWSSSSIVKTRKLHVDILGRVRDPRRLG